MQRDLNVLLVEDDRELCDEFDRCFAETEGVELVASTDSAAQALELVRELQPDAVVLDLELHMGEGNGITFLSQLSKLKGIRKPFVVVNTNNSSQTTYDVARKLGADFVMYKHAQGHSPSVIADFLLSVDSEGIGSAPIPGQLYGDTREQVSAQTDLKERIYDELNKVSISPRSKGYNYLADAIEILCGGHVPHVSAMVAEKYGKKVKSVERAMQNAIDRAWDTSDIDELLQHYKAHINARRVSPTVMEFVCYYATKLRNGN